MDGADVRALPGATNPAVIERRQSRLERHQAVQQAGQTSVAFAERVDEDEFRGDLSRAVGLVWDANPTSLRCGYAQQLNELGIRRTGSHRKRIASYVDTNDMKFCLSATLRRQGESR